MKQSSTFSLFRMVYVTFMTFLVIESLFLWPGFSYHMTFVQFLPSLAMMVLIFTILAVLITGILKIIQVIAKSIINRSGILIDLDAIYTWIFIVIFSILVVKSFKLWTDSFFHIPYWNIFKYFILILILVGASVLALKKKGEFTSSVTEKVTPLFWSFFLISTICTLVVIYHVIKTHDQGLSAQASKSTSIPSEPNIIVVSMDALSARDMSLYGYERKTNPFMEEFARESYLFTRFYSNSNFTTPSVVSILTSKYLWTHQKYHHPGTLSEDIRVENLARVLRENGYTTMSFVANPAADPLRLGFADDFDIIIPAYKLQVPHKISSYIELFFGRALVYRFYISWWWLKIYTDKIFSWNDTATSEFPIRKAFDSFFDHVPATHQPFFAWIHVWPPHFPFLPPEPYKNTFAAEGEMYSERDQMHFWGPYPASKQGKINSLRKRYDEFILYCDAEFRDFINRLKKSGLYDNSLLIFTADHGEIFEKGFFAHGGPYLYEPLVHIPMIIHEPGQTMGTRIDVLGEHIDIAPTILDYIGFNKPEWMEGESLLPSIRQRAKSTRPKFPAWFERNRALNHPITTGTVAVLDGDFKLIHYIKEDRTELYNLRLDPKEEHNLFETEPQTAQRLKSMILERIRQVNATRKG